MDLGAIQSPDFKPVQRGKRGPDSHGSCGSKFHRLEPAAQTAQTSDIATSPGEPHADAVDERFAATQLSAARARDTCETRTSCLSVPERGIQPTTKIEVLSNRPGGELEKRPISQHHFPLAPVALCIGHVEPQPSNAAEMEAPRWRVASRRVNTSACAITRSKTDPLCRKGTGPVWRRCANSTFGSLASPRLGNPGVVPPKNGGCEHAHRLKTV